MLTPLLLLVGCAAGSLLVSLVVGAGPAYAMYGVALLLSLCYAVAYWLRDSSAEELVGSTGHIGSLSLIAGVLLIVVSEAMLFFSLV